MKNGRSQTLAGSAQRRGLLYTLFILWFLSHRSLTKWVKYLDLIKYLLGGYFVTCSERNRKLSESVVVGFLFWDECFSIARAISLWKKNRDWSRSICALKFIEIYIGSNGKFVGFVVFFIMRAANVKCFWLKYIVWLCFEIENSFTSYLLWFFFKYFVLHKL